MKIIQEKSYTTMFFDMCNNLNFVNSVLIQDDQSQSMVTRSLHYAEDCHNPFVSQHLHGISEVLVIDRVFEATEICWNTSYIESR